MKLLLAASVFVFVVVLMIFGVIAMVVVALIRSRGSRVPPRIGAADFPAFHTIVHGQSDFSTHNAMNQHMAAHHQAVHDSAQHHAAHQHHCGCDTSATVSTSAADCGTSASASCDTGSCGCN